MRAAEFSRTTFYFSDQNGHGGPDSHAKEDLIPATKNAPFCGSAAEKCPCDNLHSLPVTKGILDRVWKALGTRCFTMLAAKTKSGCTN